MILFPLLVLFAITRQSEIPWRYFFSDLPVVLQVPVLACVITSLSSLLWCTSGMIALFTATVCDAPNKVPLRVIGLLSLFMGLDDLLMLHETLLPRALGMTQKMQSQVVEVSVFVAYGIVLLTWMVKYFRHLGMETKPFLIGSLLCYLFSLAADMASSLKLFGRWSRFRTDYDFQLLVEDGPKFVGVVLWSLFLWHLSRSKIIDVGAN